MSEFVRNRKHSKRHIDITQITLNQNTVSIIRGTVNTDTGISVIYNKKQQIAALVTN